MIDRNRKLARFVTLSSRCTASKACGAGSEFRAVGTALLMKATGYIGIDIDMGGIPAGSGATCDPNRDKILFPSATFGSTLTEQMIIVDKRIHAIFDSNDGERFSEEPGTTAETTADKIAARSSTTKARHRAV